MNDTAIVIPMAGFGRRFADAGYDLPKHELEIDGRPLFDWSVGSFGSYASTSPFVVVLRRDDGTERFVRERAEVLGIADLHVVALDGPTDGQAETVQLGIDRSSVSDDVPIAIFNVDTVRPGLSLPDAEALARAGGFLEVFEAPGEGWSFAARDAAGGVTEVREKERISPHACTGLYVFSRAGDFRAAYDSPRPARTTAERRERYVAPLYNRLIADGTRVELLEVDPAAVVPCGIPDEYEALVSAGVTYPHPA